MDGRNEFREIFSGPNDRSFFFLITTRSSCFASKNNLGNKDLEMHRAKNSNGEVHQALALKLEDHR